MIKEIVDIKLAEKEIHGFELEKVTTMLGHLCLDQEVDGFYTIFFTFLGITQTINGAVHILYLNRLYCVGGC